MLAAIKEKATVVDGEHHSMMGRKRVRTALLDMTRVIVSTTGKTMSHRFLEVLGAGGVRPIHGGSVKSASPRSFYGMRI